MTPKEQGRFCDFCSKDVVDFTSMSDEKIVVYFEQTNGKLCGRFSQSQVSRELVFLKPTNQNRFLLARNWLTASLLVGASQISKAQHEINPQVSIHSEPIAKKNENQDSIPVSSSRKIQLLISGIVKDSSTLEPMSHVQVYAKILSTGCKSDEEGKFNLSTQIDQELKTLDLELRFPGYYAKYVTLNLPNSSDTNHLEIKNIEFLLTENSEITLMGEFEIIYTTKPLRRFFRRLKFRKR